MIINTDPLFSFVVVIFIWIGNRNPHLRPLKQHFHKIGHAILRTGQLLLICVNMLSIFVRMYQI